MQARKCYTLGVVVILFGLLACSRGGSHAGGPVEQGEVVLSLTLPDGVSLDRVDYTIEGPNAFSSSGSISAQGSGGGFTATVDQLPVASGYTLRLTALELDNSSVCTGTSQFDVMVDQTTEVNVTLHCPGTRRTGSAAINGHVDICPVVDWISRMASADGKSITLTGVVRDVDGDTSSLHYSWSASQGTFDSASSPTAVLACPSAGGTVQVTLEVSDGACSDRSSLMVPCNAPPACMEHTDGGVAMPAAEHQWRVHLARGLAARRIRFDRLRSGQRLLGRVRNAALELPG